MAEPGDPRKPEDDFDDQVGFCTPQSIAGRSVEPAPDARPDEARFEPSPLSEPDPPEPEVLIEEPVVEATPAPVFVSRAERRRALEEEPRDRLTWALTIYALILLAVPTLGFSAILGLLAVTGRTVNASPFLLSHYVYQQRTLWTAGIAALIGLILIVVNLGVFVLFLLVVWTIARGAAGVWRLKNAQPISDPRTWLF